MGQPAAIEVRNLSKGFEVRGPRASSRSRLRGLIGRGGRRLEVLDKLSFEVGRGEFFGIVGRNGSGKSTLLKLLASVYHADAGTIRIAGHLAPFLELGVGFNPKLTARDNVVLNAVMMGLSPAEARRRCAEVIEFAGLEDYTDLPIKNYSSGMKARLGFAVMTHVDADILLIDEVLAVGDAEFQDRCGETFEQMHREGRTILLVTHSMPTVTGYCERAMLLHDGVIGAIGAPDHVAERYYDVNLSAALQRPNNTLPEISSRIVSAIGDPLARISESRLIDESGQPVATLAAGAPIRVLATVEVRRELADPRFLLQIAGSDGRIVFRSDRAQLAGGADAIAGQTLEVEATIENRLPAGRFTIALDVYQGTETPAGPTKMLRLEVTGGRRRGGIHLEHDIRVRSGATEGLAGR